MGQRPRIASVPPRASSAAGREAVDLAAYAGLYLDPWQAWVLDQALGERSDGKWAAFEVGLVVSRQNGKGAVLEARELAGLFLFGERLIMHSAHQFDTALEAFRRILFLVESTPDLDSRVKRVSRAHGEEGIELKSGQRLRFKARTSSGGRGFSGDVVILDEAMILPPAAMGALMPTMSARPNPQLWYVGSAVDKDVHPDGLTLATVRRRGMAGSDPSLAYLEWSAGEMQDLLAGRIDPFDEAVQIAANPGVECGRITLEHVAREQRSMLARTFATERLGVGDWPTEDELTHVIAPKVWADLTDPVSRPSGPLAFGVDIDPNRTQTVIGVAIRRNDGRIHLEIVDKIPGSAGAVARIQALASKYGPMSVVVDERSPAASLLPALHSAGVVVQATSARAMGQACGQFYDDATSDALRHLGQFDLDQAMLSAKTRPIGDGAWGWDRKDGGATISPLVAVTLAAYGLSGTDPSSIYESRGLVSL